MLVLPYGIRFREDGRLETFPIAEIILFGRDKKEVGGVYLIDSGATTSIAPAHDAVLLNIPLSRGRKTIIRGIGETHFSGYRHIVSCAIGAIICKIPIVFIEDPTTPRILGREGFFGNFGILFDEGKHRIALLEVQEERNRINAIFNDASQS
ncbi:MAG: hypothetical protein AAB539_02600 [Patescibacteria group bacterium]